MDINDKKLLHILTSYTKNIYILDNTIILEYDNITVSLQTDKELTKNINEYQNIPASLLKKIKTIEAISINILMGQAYYNKVLNIAQFYYKFFNKFICIDIHYDNSMFIECSHQYYKINLPKKQLLYENFTKQLIKRDFNEGKELLNYLPFFSSNNLILDIPKSITTQTKVRRLGYLSIILEMFNDSKYYPLNIFNKKIEQRALQYNKTLQDYTDDKGLINISKTGNSAKPYIDFLISLKLLYYQSHTYQLSKYGKIYGVLFSKLDLDIEEGSKFALNVFQKSFYLLFLLQNDMLYLFALLEIIYIQNNDTTASEIKNVFQEYILESLEFTIKYSKLSTKFKNEISKKIIRIKQWEKPKVYLEHIVDPRINWLLDLGLLNKEKYLLKRISLSNRGLKLLSYFGYFFDQSEEKFTISRELRCHNFFNIINIIYDINAKEIQKSNLILVEKYIDESFTLFKTIAPNRVTASQAILYTCYMMLFKEGIIVNFCTIQQYLYSKKNTKFIFDWYKTENDGSIRRKK